MNYIIVKIIYINISYQISLENRIMYKSINFSY